LGTPTDEIKQVKEEKKDLIRVLGPFFGRRTPLNHGHFGHDRYDEKGQVPIANIWAQISISPMS